VQSCDIKWVTQSGYYITTLKLWHYTIILRTFSGGYTGVNCMKLVLIVLNKVDKLDDFLEGLIEHGISGATIIDSTGLVKELARKSNDFPIFASIRFRLELDDRESKTIFMVLNDEQVETVRRIIREVVGDLSKPDTAVLFTLPVLTAEGV
jgi:nitrogen regulatory protein PII